MKKDVITSPIQDRANPIGKVILISRVRVRDNQHAMTLIK